MRLEDLNWMDVESYLHRDDRLLVVLGACEQHGYLSLATDLKIPLALADAVSEKTGVLVAPALPFGCSPYFMSYPGTISLRAKTYLDVVEDIVRSVHSHGFRGLMILNGHGGNQGARILLEELLNALEGLRLGWYSWWQAPRVTQVAASHGLKSSHGGWIEAFRFTQVAPLPQGVKGEIKAPDYLPADKLREVYGDGVFGGPYSVDVKILDELFAVAVEDIIAELDGLRRRATHA
jgi:creatinine amidohydrolase